LADIDHQAGLLGQGDELGGGDEAFVGALPTQQCFGPCQRAVAVDLRLEEKAQFTVG